MSAQTAGLKWHRLLLPVVDVLLLNIALVLALWLRFEGGVPADWWDFYEHAVLWITPLLLISSGMFGLYNRVWEYASGEVVAWLLAAVSFAVAVGSVGVSFTAPLFSRSVLVMTWAFTLLAIGGSRFGWRQIRRQLWKKERASGNGEHTRILIYGAGHSGTAFAAQLETSYDSAYVICGFVDDNPSLQGMIAGNHKVLGVGADLPRLVEAFEIDRVILAVPSASGDVFRQMRDRVAQAGAEVGTLPRLLETVGGETSSSDVRGIRYEDLLGRDMTNVEMDLDPNYVKGRTVLVTGAGGSIGSEICRQLCRYNPARLILLGRGENRIHRILRRINSESPETDCIPVICNFTNAEHVEQVFEQYRPEVVFHAGAHKHVYLMQAHPAEAVRNNVVGTGNVAQAADRFGVDRFVAISTDKAVEPCNVMGASKRLCEILIGKLNVSSKTKFMAVRFGNVIGSSGSVLTIFQQQAEAGESLTVTHREATRFFMTVEEAAFLVLHAGALGNGGDIFVLEMGEPICIYEMAREFLELNGRDPDEPGSIDVTALATGEKVHEVLCSAWEELEPTASERINRVRVNGQGGLDYTFDELLARARASVADQAAAEELLTLVCRRPLPVAQSMFFETIDGE